MSSDDSMSSNDYRNQADTPADEQGTPFSAQPDVPAGNRPADDSKAEARAAHAGETLGADASSTAPQGLQKDPEDWVTGDEPMTPAQRSYLDNLARQAGVELPANLTKAEASEQIDKLQSRRQGN